ncbi:MAG: DUF58 domain-containing protein [Acidimicrobiales bacterium]|jgi:uncharacterized protein (DUF58 family)
MKPSQLRPTSRGVVALASLAAVVVAAIATGTPELAPLVVVIAVPLAVCPWLALRRARRTTGSTELHAHVEPGPVPPGSPMRVRLLLTNRSTGGSAFPPLGLPSIDRQWRARGAAPGSVPRRRRLAPSLPSMVALPAPGPGRTGSCLLEVPTRRRGVLELPPQRVWAHDPFGLFGAPGPVTPAVIAVVHPAPLTVDQVITGIPGPLAGAEPDRGTGRGTGLGELEGIRPYVSGDRLSLLHWPAKARYGTWFVRQFGAEGSKAVSLVVDDRAGVHRRAEFERLISAVLGVVVETTRDRRVVHLATLTGSSYSFEPSDRGRAEARLVLAELQPVGGRTPAVTAPVSADSVVLTTRTGAERLTAGPVGSGIRPEVAGARVIIV